MAITTYSELNTAVANWLARADLANRVPEFIALCEARYHRTLRVPGMEKRAETVLAISTEYVALPTDFMEVRNFQIQSSPVVNLKAMSPDDIDMIYGGVAGTPQFYAIVGDEIQLAPAPDSAYELEMDYWAKLTPLSSVDTSNWMLQNAPDVYLFGSLCEAIPFVKDDKRTMLWETKYKAAVDDLNAASARRRWPSSSMVMRNSNHVGLI